MREEIKTLEDHADASALGGNAFVRKPLEPAVGERVVFVAHTLTTDPDFPDFEGFQLIDAPQQGRFSGA